jgi:ubiquinone/menaquinone biosynthesis C-methylase UbiE
MLYDFSRLIPGITVAGIDISEYATNNAKDEVKPFVKVGDARELPFEDNSFDLVTSITTVHNLERADCKKSLQELERVSSRDKFITVDAYFNDFEKKRMDMWNLTALTYMHTDEWKEFLEEAGYTGDYHWFIP